MPDRMPSPALTIVICNYNYAQFLAAAIDSALAQSTSNVRVMVIDDGSTDGSREIIESYGARVEAIFQPNGGQVAAYNHALERVDTPYVLFLDADDMLHPAAAATVVAAFSGSGDWVKVQYRLDVMTRDGMPTGVQVPQSIRADGCGRMLRNGWLYPSPPGSGNAYRVDALRRIFPVPVTADNIHGADFYAIYGVALLGKVCAIDQALGCYRVHRSASTDGPGSELSFTNAEDSLAVARQSARRWSVLRQIAQERLDIALPPAPLDFSAEKARFAQQVYGASFTQRWRWFQYDSGRYFHTIVANPFWTLPKKIAVWGLTVLCLFPAASFSDRVVRYIANPLARAGH
ncbi:glycosyltransferase family 2 protein [Cupriavidus plantarum]|uniref:Glycosyl transferase family 2 n=1 Tax=Cupriavidus plantarum TaxID=942865 RepID=A0A316EU33_9BURK|nr:glycosyltransferase family A protein [Cupriavidus plantarum]NYI00841.1 glycosyltransferase involved in cell wall biosynthesis [Cupriavidus plantarum]PWK35252.1 glycosyl transferase family 2 [Cupriavidus plantarum]REE93697.1 glycosyl transferase family 2 [Cupriavidus plantarum]